jgi:hypothetical protein
LPTFFFSLPKPLFLSFPLLTLFLPPEAFLFSQKKKRKKRRGREKKETNLGNFGAEERGKKDPKQKKGKFCKGEKRKERTEKRIKEREKERERERGSE